MAVGFLSPDATPQGLTLIKSQTIGSAVSTVSVTSAFNATYNAYKIVVSGGVGSATGNLQLKLGSSTSSYSYGFIYQNLSSGTPTGEVNQGGSSIWNYVGGTTTNGLWMSVDLINPYLAKWTRLYAVTGNGDSQGGILSGTHKVASSYTDFTLGAETGTLTGGEIRVYGYQL